MSSQLQSGETVQTAATGTLAQNGQDHTAQSEQNNNGNQKAKKSTRSRGKNIAVSFVFISLVTI